MQNNSASFFLYTPSFLKGIVKGVPLNVKAVKIGGVYLDFNSYKGLAR